MAEHAAPLRSPQKRVEHIKAMATEIGTQQREVMHLVILTFQALYLFFAFACLTAGVVAEVNGKHSTAVVWGAIGIVLAGIWLFVKVLSKSMKKFVRALKSEMQKLPGEMESQFGHGPGLGGSPGPGLPGLGGRVGPGGPRIGPPRIVGRSGPRLHGHGGAR